MSVKTKSSLIQRLHQAKEGKRKAVSPVIATLLLIAIAVAAGIVLYVFVSGLTTSLSNVRGTVTQPLQVTVIQVGSGCGGSSGCTITFQLVNPNGAAITLTNVVITDNTGAQITQVAPAGTCSITTAIAPSFSGACSITVSGLNGGNTYRLTVYGADLAGNQYSSNPAVFTAR